MREEDYFALIEKYQGYMNDLVESVKQSNKVDALDQLAMLLIVAQNIQKVSILAKETKCLAVDNALLQSTTKLSQCLGEIWSCNEVDQEDVWKQIIPLLERLRKAPVYN